MSERPSQPPERAAACFVDFDNLFDGLLEDAAGGIRKRALDGALNLLTNLRDHLRDVGVTTVVGRAYSAFDEYPGSEAAHTLSLIGYEPQYALHTKGRRSSELQLSLDLLEVLLSRADIDMFVLIGGNEDFLPIARKVLEARRELRVVSMPNFASGELLDRVGHERFIDASELIEFGEEASPPAAEPAAPEPAPPRRGAKILGHTTLPTVKWSPRSDQEALSEERQDQCLRLLIELSERFGSGDGSSEVWLSPFLKNEMAMHFPDLTHPQRRRLVNLLKEHEKIMIEERESQTGPYPYSVVLVNREHPAVGALISAR